MSADEEVLWSVSVRRARVKEVCMWSLTYDSPEMVLPTVDYLDFQQLLFQLRMGSLAAQYRLAWEMVQCDETGAKAVKRIWYIRFRTLAKPLTPVVG